MISDQGAEILIYDESVSAIHRLNEVSVALWRLCDGTRTVEAIGRESGYGMATAHVAVMKLEAARLLLQSPPANAGVESSGRRQFLKKAGLAAVPAIVSVTAPTAAMAGSGEVECVGSGCRAGGVLFHSRGLLLGGMRGAAVSVAAAGAHLHLP